MAISMVGATPIWKFVYYFIGDPTADQVGLINSLLTKIGMDPI